MSGWSKKQLFGLSNSTITLPEWSSLPNEHPRELPIMNHKQKESYHSLIVKDDMTLLLSLQEGLSKSFFYI